jgi:molecular chaperone GrpE
VAGTESSPAPERADQESSRERELEDLWRRTAADLDNLRKRAIRDTERERTAERIRVNAAWLPVVDNLELALSHAEGAEHPLVQGITAIRDQAVDILRRQGFPPVDEVGVPFDPHLHEVVAVVDDPSVPPGAVAAVLRRGYGGAERQLRPAMVAVTKRDG